MATFPLLSTGAVSQYPLPAMLGQPVQVIRFLDGLDQRFLLQGRSFRRWQIRLDLLNEAELQQIESFFEAQSGDYSTFTFPDPFTGAAVTNCRIGEPLLSTDYSSFDAGSTSFWVVETNG